MKESEERFRHISSSISDISYSCETDLIGNSTINWLYGAVEEITGYTLEEVIATKCWGKLVIDEDFPIFKSCILEVVPGQSKECQLRLKKKDGSVVWIQATSECVKGTNDNGLNLIYGGLVDISDRKLAEQALQTSEAQFREFFEKAADAIFIAEIESGIIVDANEAASRLMLRPHNELIGIHQTELHPPEIKDYSKNTFKEQNEKVRNKQTSFAIETNVIRANGLVVPVEIMASEVVFQGKHCMMGTFRDITERKRTEDELRQNVSRLELAMSTANMSWWEMDMATGLVAFEKRKAEMLGYAPEKFKHYTDFMALVHPEDYERTMDAMRLHLNGSLDKYEVEYRIKIITGEYKWFYDIGSVTKRDSEGKPLIVSGLVLNISERKQAEEALKSSSALTESTLESIHNGILVVDQAGKVIKTSSRFAEMWQIPNEIMVTGDDKTLMNYILDQLIDPDEFVSKVLELYAKPEAESTDLVYFKDGRIFERVSKPMHLDGKAIGRVWSFLDITERKSAELALKESQSLYFSLIEQLPNPVFRKDREGRFILVNSQFCKLKGLNSEHFIGLTASEVAANEMAVQGKTRACN